MSETKGSQSNAVQTTGHAWDGDLQEFNNPLPRWWLWSFYATVVFAVLYWFLFPAWPMGESYTTGLATITYPVNGEERTTGWNTRAKLINELHNSPSAVRQQEYLTQVMEADYQQIIQDPEMLAFVRSVGRGLFGDNCAACHGRGGQGVMGLYPNLADDAWLWGGSMERIEETLYQGRQGYMPAFKEVLDQKQLADVSEYVLFLSGQAPMGEAVQRGGAIFQGMEGGCYYCHGRNGKGLESQGAANLTDQIWTIAAVSSQETLDGKREAVANFIWEGVQNWRVMPAWEHRLKPSEIKVLSVYVHQLSGGI